MPKAQETVLEIDLRALKHNLEHLKSKLQEKTKFLAVVKAFAYGSEACRIAQHLEALHIDYFAVAFVKEGIVLRKAGVTTPILVLHPQTANIPELIAFDLEPSLYNAKILTAFVEQARAKQLRDYPVHIKFNTGLNRLGFSEKDVDSILSQLKTPAVKVTSLFSHLAASEDLNETEFSLQQINEFKGIAKTFIEHLDYTPMLHMCNTSGIINYPEAHFDMVRSGIGLYGYGNSKAESAPLIPIATLKTIISQIHFIEKGESVGYNRAFQSESVTKTATLPIGHADGISRIYGHGKGFVTINGQKAPIIGNVCMDMLMINISGIDCEEGDEVVLFGPHATSAETLAESANTISYELITGISQRVKRMIIE
ncbi:alanine racemase [Aestuariivivens sediminicola]|uniref:alanine racemase n=1 Tax=Aestuariivivens sediminicola TaxID=2913560 RepID=UPI001F573C96|nr:alanine racemase [Aestuariivivens sediminicola]